MLFIYWVILYNVVYFFSYSINLYDNLYISVNVINLWGEWGQLFRP